MPIKISNLAIGGYRSFGSVQYFQNFKKINLFIGRNNSGKSNILRFINNIYANQKDQGKYKADPIDRHLPNGDNLIIGLARYTEEKDKNLIKSIKNDFFSKHESQLNINEYDTIFRIYEELKNIEDQSLAWSLYSVIDSKIINKNWLSALKKISNDDLRNLWSVLTESNGGSRSAHWEPQTIEALKAPLPKSIDSHFIPAIRQIAINENNDSSGYDGAGIINKLAKLQNPDVHSQELRKRFLEINSFVQSVLDRKDATIEIPYDRNTILVHMDNKVLPLDSLGTGVHEVIILAAAATTLNDTVLCIEEPELHLNPILQRKLLKYLSEKTSNQYFITTHSPAIMDTKDAEIYHVTQSDGESKITRATSDRMKSDACEDLGYHPSDLLQTNCVIWVEGPSDRIYIKYWLKHAAPEFNEGIHYAIMFYGGRLLSHLSGEENEMALDEFISLRKLNKRGVIVIDSDKSTAHTHLNRTKKRLIEEFNKGPGFSWVTAGREIENYFTKDQLEFGILAATPNCNLLSDFGKFDNCLKIKGQKGAETQASKTDVAHAIVRQFDPILETYDLKDKIQNVVEFIRESNPATKA